jgi:AhpD family alkylhydroperoxidase
MCPKTSAPKFWKSRKRLGLYRKCSWLLPVALQSGEHFLPTTTPSWCQSPWAAPVNLTKGDREMIVTTTSAANHCLYCVVAHGAILRIYEKKPLIADQVAVNYRKADISPRQRAMLDFAMKVCLHSDQIEDADFAPLHAHGLDDEDIWDIAAITAFFGLSNRMASFSNMMPNPEFYLMGRVPKQK